MDTLGFIYSNKQIRAFKLSVTNAQEASALAQIILDEAAWHHTSVLLKSESK